MKRWFMHRLLVALVTLSSTVLSGQSAQAAETIRINGTGSGLDMMKPLIAAYVAAHPGVRIEMEKPLGSGGAIKALLEGALDLAISSRPLKPEESARGARLHTYGRTPLLIVTEKGLVKSNITTEELENVYNGRTKIWPNGSQVRPILRPEGDSDVVLLKGLSPGMGAALQAARSRPGMIVAVTDPEANEAVARTEGGIGAAALPGIAAGKLPLNVLSLNGVRGTLQTVANGSYPLARSLDFITTPSSSPAVAKFLEFAYSTRGRHLAERAGVLVIAGPKETR